MLCLNSSLNSELQFLIIRISTFLVINTNIIVIVFNVECVNAIWTYITINKANLFYQFYHVK